MSRTKELGTAAGTLVCALGIGFAMQNTDAASERYGLSGTPVATASVVAIPDYTLSGETSEPVVDVQDITLTSALPSFANTSDASGIENGFSQMALTEIEAPAVKPDTPAMQIACDILAMAAAKPRAMVELNVIAPCNGGQSVTVHHNGLVFKELTGADGSVTLTVPAMSHSAVYIFSFETGEGAVAHAKITDLEGLDRVALQWKGNSGFELHAREFGAGYGEAGHMWHEGRDMNGQFVRLGQSTDDIPQYAEIYTFPSDAKLQDGRVDLTVEAEVTDANCGSQIEAEALQIGKEGTVHTKTLSLTLPACDAVGNYLVLNNVFDGLKLASR
ncbi:MAG: hypothetical protein AAF754_05580 [Pseudomonadota bacterium]